LNFYKFSNGIVNITNHLVHDLYNKYGDIEIKKNNIITIGVHARHQTYNETHERNIDKGLLRCVKKIVSANKNKAITIDNPYGQSDIHARHWGC
jgi:hypothetical protein